MYNKDRLITIMIASIVLINIVIIPIVSANGDNQYYMGAYYKRSRKTTDKVIFNCDFSGTDPDDVPDGNFLMAVATARV